MTEFKNLEKLYTEVFNVHTVQNENCSLISDYYDYEATDIFYFIYLVSEYYSFSIELFLDIIDDLSYEKIRKLVKTIEEERS